MADKKISELDPLAQVDIAINDFLPIVTSPGLITMRVKASDIVAKFQNPSATWGAITGTLSDQSDLDTALAGKQASLGFTAENVANKDTDTALAANSDTKYPSQKAVKSYIDTGLGTKQASLGFTAENVANKDTDTALAANSDTKYPSQKAIKAYVDSQVSSAGSISAYAALEDAVIPYTRFGQHMVAATKSLTAVNIGLNNPGAVSSTVVIQLNQFRAGVLINTARATITLAAGVDGGSVGVALTNFLSGAALSLLSGDKVTFDCNSVTGGCEWLTVQF